MTNFNSILNRPFFVITYGENSYKSSEILLVEDFDVASEIIEEHELYEEEMAILPRLYHGMLLPAKVLSINTCKQTLFLLKVSTKDIEEIHRTVFSLSAEAYKIEGAITHPTNYKWTHQSLATNITSLANRFGSDIDQIFILVGYRIIPKLRTNIEMVDEEIITSLEEHITVLQNIVSFKEE